MKTKYEEYYNMSGALSVACITTEHELKDLREMKMHSGICYEIVLKRHKDAKRAYELFCKLDLFKVLDVIDKVLENE